MYEKIFYIAMNWNI